MRRLVLAVAILAAAGYAAVAVAGAEPAPRYRLAAVTTADVSRTVSVSGTVDHVNRADVSFGTSGTVATLSVTVGAAVTAGQELGTLDVASLQAAVDQATAALDEAESNLATASASASTSASRPSSQDAASAALAAAADAVAAQAAACADPTAAACAAAASATLTAQQAAQDALRSLLDALSTQLSAPSSTDSVAEAQAAVDEANVKLVEAQQALAGATLTSPVTGTVASVPASVGTQVSAGDTAVVVIGTGAAEVSATVPVEQVDELAVGQPATVTPVGTTESVPGTVTRVGTLPADGTETVSYPVTITVDAPPPTMAAGSSATAAVVVAVAEDVLTVPTSAVNRGTVTVLSGDQATTTRVTVGVVGPTRTEIQEGVSAGDQVVLANLDTPVPTSDQQQNTGPGGGFTGGGPGGGPMMRTGPGGK